MAPSQLLLPPPWHAHATTVLVVHLVWSTRGRCPWLEPRLDAWLAALLERKARALSCHLLAVGNADDHVHTLACHPARVSVSQLAHRLKGASSHALPRAWPARAQDCWQVGYWAESVSPHDCGDLAAYVRGQRAHHCEATGAEPWELTLSAAATPGAPPDPTGRRG